MRAVSFWKTVLAVALGVLVAGVVAWIAVELRARAELAALAEYAEQEAAELAADAERRAMEARHRDSVRRARIEAAKPPILPAAVPPAVAGRRYCMEGYIVVRVDNGWYEILHPKTAKRFPCRVR